MTSELETVTPKGSVFRLARAPDPWKWPDWNRAGPDGTFGHRWDDPAGTYRVLYASSTRIGALIETLSPFRADLNVVAELREIEGDDDLVAAGTIPRDWFEQRLMGVAEIVGSYADIGAAGSLSLLRSRLAARGIHYGLSDIDAAAIRLVAPRSFTQEVSRFVHEYRTEGVEPLAGIRYQSRLDDGTSNWAIFEPMSDSPAPLRSASAEPIQPDDPDVIRAAALLGLLIG